MRKELKSFVTMLVVGGILGLGAVPATAAPPLDIQQFMPQDQDIFGPGCGGAPNCEPDALSDKFDGVDSLAHLTAVATSDTDNVTWYACPLGTAATPTQAQLTACNVTIGTDPSGRQPSGGTFLAPIDEAYDVTWDIPGSLDQQRRDIVAVACIGTGQDIEGGDANCTTDNEEDIFLEDAQTGTAANQTSSGEFGQLRTRPTCLDTASGNAACDAVRKDFPHGTTVPNTGFDFLAFTSDDVNALGVTVNSPSDAVTEPAPGNQLNGPLCTLEQTLTNFKRWRCFLNDAAVPDNAEMAISLDDNTAVGVKPEGTGGYCNAQNNPASTPSAQNEVPGAHDFCILDSHYVVSIPAAVTTIVQTFQPQGTPPNPPANTSCASPDKSEANNLGGAAAQNEDITICATDNFGDPIDVPVTEEIAGPGRFDDCGDLAGPVAHDHPTANGTNEHCHGTLGADGTATGITVSNIDDATPGTVTITSCYDPENGGPAATPPTNHGCGNASGTLKDTLTLTFGAVPGEVFLAFAGTATNAGDPCRTGATIANGTIGQRETLVVCTFDTNNGNPVSTGVDASRLQWSIIGAHGNDSPSVRFVGTPPSETGANGQATVEIDDIAGGDNFIIVTLLDANGDVDDVFQVEKDVAGKQQAKKKCKKQKRRRNAARRKLVDLIRDDAPTAQIKRAKRKLRKANRRLRKCRRAA